MIIEAEKLNRSFGAVTAVEDISFTMTEGESLALVGPNGAGKLTTFGLLATVIRPDGGTARVLGADIVAEPQHVRAGLGVLFQEPALDDRLTPRETLELHAALHGISSRDTTRRVQESLCWADWIRSRSASFAACQAARSGGSNWIAPSLLIFDEPTLGLDPQGRSGLWSRIDRLRTNGMSVLLTTHVLAEAEH